MKEVYIKTFAVIFGSIIITLVLTIFLFESDSPTVKPNVARIFTRISDTVIGSEGKPVVSGVDPTPPPSIYY